MYKMEVGTVYSFNIIDIIDISDEEFYILKDPNEVKHLLPCELYKHYKFEIGQNILCKVDKINCVGKMYLEPENPKYSVNKSYDFNFIEEKSIVNDFGTTERHFIVCDDFDIKHQLWVSASEIKPKNGQKIKLAVAQIRKGKIMLFCQSIFYPLRKQKPKNKYSFRITGIASLLHEKEFFCLLDENKQLHFLRIKPFISNNYKIGDKIDATVVSTPQLGNYYLEPVYEGYEIENTYDFKFLKEEEYFHPSGEKENTWIVLDKNNKECHLFLTDKIDYKLQNHNIRATVEYIFKGKLFLRFVNDVKNHVNF